MTTLDPAQVTAAAHQGVTIAADQYRASRRALARYLQLARDHGLTLDELVADSGLPHVDVAELLKEATV